MDITFNESFAETLQHALNKPVIGLQLDLQFGDLTRLNAAQNAFWTLKAHYDAGSSQHDYATVTDKIAQLQQVIATGEPLRVWWSEMPDDLVGFYWLCDELMDKPNQLSQIKIPMTAPKTEGSLGFHELGDVGEIVDEEVPQYLTLEEPVALAERRVYDFVWQGLLDENASVRANLNGHLIGVAEDFYDGLLMTQPHADWDPLQVIGETIGQSPVGVPAWWYSYRLDQLR